MGNWFSRNFADAAIDSHEWHFTVFESERGKPWLPCQVYDGAPCDNSC